MQRAVEMDQRSREKGLHLESRDVQLPAYAGVVGIEHLEAAIEPEPVDDIGGNPPADPVGVFDDDGLDTGPAQGPGGDQPRQTGTDDHDVGVCGESHRPDITVAEHPRAAQVPVRAVARLPHGLSES